MNKKGFTLVELLAVLVILSLLLGIVIFSVGNIVNKSKDELSSVQIDSIKQAAKTYYLKEGMSESEIDSDNYEACVDVKYLVENGYVENEIIDPNDNKKMNGSVLITYESNKYKYSYQKQKCNSNFYKDGDIIYFDVAKGESCTKEEYESSYGETVNYDEDGNEFVINDYLNSSTGYNGIDKTSELQNSCLKFYAFNDDGDDKINLILDHNTVATIVWNSSGDNREGPKEAIIALKENTKDWQGTLTPDNHVAYTLGNEYKVNYRDNGYKARFITANEIAQITNNLIWEETLETSMTFHLDSNDIVAHPLCTIGNTSGCKYRWLHERTNTNCKENGCLNNSDEDTAGYWTISSSAFISATDVHQICDGHVTFGVSHRSRVGYTCPQYEGHYGVRPVIEVSRNKLSK